jgi:hypothetical protein
MDPPEDVREAAAANAARRHKIFMRRVESAWAQGNPLDSLAHADEEAHRADGSTERKGLLA